MDQFNRRRNAQDKLSETQKLELINKIIDKVFQLLESIITREPEDFFYENRPHFFEIKSHLEVLARIQNKSNVQLKKLKIYLERKSHMTIITKFGKMSQEDIMRSIFRNEERVWRERGGRPDDETLDLFLGFIATDAPGNSS